MLAQQAQVVAAGVGDTQGEVAAQPGAADVQGSLHTAGEAATGPRSQQQPRQRGDGYHQDRRGPAAALGDRRATGDQRHDTQGDHLGDEDRAQGHRPVGQDQLVAQAHS